MNATVCKIKIHIPDNHSLKGKRQIIKSIISRIRNQFNVSIAEVENQDLWQLATLGIASVGNSHSDETINNILKYIEQNYPDIEVIDHETEIMQGF
jgi:uncharacterized protein YlxP (DUF503 family)